MSTGCRRQKILLPGVSGLRWSCRPEKPPQWVSRHVAEIYVHRTQSIQESACGANLRGATNASVPMPGRPTSRSLSHHCRRGEVYAELARGDRNAQTVEQDRPRQLEYFAAGSRRGEENLAGQPATTAQHHIDGRQPA